MSEHGSTASERVYRALLRAYSHRFRDQYGTDALELFRDHLREARSSGGPPAIVRLWLRTVPNVLWHGFLERLSVRERSRRPARGMSLRSALRSLTRSPGLSAVIVITLAVGIGANVALFSVLRGVLLRPLPYPDAERLVRVWETNPSVDDELHGPSPLNFADWERESPSRTG